MSFLQLPPEIQLSILDHVLYDVGIRKFVAFRVVCRTFRKHVTDAIYRLPTFQSLEDSSPPHLSWDLRMGKHLIAGLIGAKMKPQLGARGLLHEIRQTSQLMSSLGFSDADEYTQALVNLSAEFLPLPEVIKQLSAQPHTVHRTRLLNNALVAAVYLSKASDLKSLRAHGAEIVPPDSALGEPLTVAACHANPNLFFHVAHESLRTGDKMQQRLCASRLLIALSSAATMDQKEVFSDELRALLDELEEPESVAYTIMLRSALLAGSTGVVTKLASWLKDEDSRKRYIQDDRSWLEIMRLACVGDYREIVDVGCTYTSALDIDNGNDLLLQDASMAGHLQLVRSLMKYPSTDLGRDTSIWWAARNSRWDIVEALEENTLTLQNFLNALSGAFSQNKRAASKNCTRGPGHSQYSDLVDLFLDVTDMKDLVCRRQDPLNGQINTHEQPRGPRVWSEDDILANAMGPEVRALHESCLTGEIPNFSLELSKIPSVASLHGALPGCFSYAIESTNVSLIHYLSARFPQGRFFIAGSSSSTKSIGVFQVLLDHGWKINATNSPRNLSPLANHIDSERSTNWFLDHGADLNQPGDWDLTPLSIAVRDAPLNTIMLMLRRGGDVRKGQLLHFAVERQAPDQLAIIDRLLACGAPINARKYESDAWSWMMNRLLGMKTPLHKAVELNLEDVVRLLLNRGADPTIKDSRGRSAYSDAIERGYEAIAQLVSLEQ